MSQENLCFYNKFGFCKFGEKCFRLHGNKICENGNCKVVDTMENLRNVSLEATVSFDMKTNMVLLTKMKIGMKK